MKTFLILILIGVLAWLVWDKLAAPVELAAVVPKQPQAEARAQATPEPVTSKEPQMSDDERIPISFRQRAMREGMPSEGLAEKFYSALEKVEPMQIYKGTIIQHLEDGNLLVDVWTIGPGKKGVPPGTIAVFGVPGAENIADQTALTCMVFPVGTYQYISTDGAKRTIYEFIWVPKDWGTAKAAPTPKPTPVGQVSVFPPGVETPEQRRAYLEAYGRSKRAGQ